MGYFKTAMLMAAMTALFMGLGYLLGGSGGMVIALVMAAAMNVFTWWNSDRMVLRMHQARPVTAGDRSGLTEMTAPGFTPSRPSLRGTRACPNRRSI